MQIDFSSGSIQSPGRRKFIGNGLKSIGGAALLTIPGVGYPKELFTQAPGYTVQQIINLIIRDIPGAPFPKTVDTIKFGSADASVNGIVTTMFPTVDVIEQAARRNANLMIVHEPTYYNGDDNTEWVKGNKVLKQKQQLLEKHGITIWRFHDYCHRMEPDMVRYGALKKMKWLEYEISGKKVITIPPVKLEHLVQQLKTNLDIRHLRIMGDLSQSCSSIALMPGAWGGQAQVGLVEESNPDVLILGEQVEWETTEYIRDARKLGAKTAMVVLGHAVSEEPGMEVLADWLGPKIPGIPVVHIASGDPFTWL